MIPQPPAGQGPIDPRIAVSNQAGVPPTVQNPPPPMPMMPPGYPMMSGMYPPPPRKRGFARGLFRAVLFIAFFVSLALNLLLISGSAGVGATADQNVIQHGDSRQKVAVIPLSGIIDGPSARRFERFIDLCEKDAGVKAVVIEIDSPGGTVTASDEIYERVRRYKASHPGTPIVVTMGSLATSGGYYVACAADYVFAQNTTMTGNIGVIMPRFNFNKLMEKYGVEETTIVSNGATFKNAGSNFSQETPAERAYLQELIDDSFKRFKQVVQAGRGARLTAQMQDIANGKVYTADAAKDLGLIDDIGYADDAYQYAASKTKLTRPMVVRYDTPPSLLDFLTSKTNLAPAASGAVSLQIDADTINRLSISRPMYLWRGQ